MLNEDVKSEEEEKENMEHWSSKSLYSSMPKSEKDDGSQKNIGNEEPLLKDRSPTRIWEKPWFRGGYAIDIQEGQDLSLFDIHNKSRTILDHTKEEVFEIQTNKHMYKIKQIIQNTD